MKNFREDCAIVCITTPTLKYVMTVVHNPTGNSLTEKGLNQDNLEYRLLAKLRDRVCLMGGKPSLADPTTDLLWI